MIKCLTFGENRCSEYWDKLAEGCIFKKIKNEINVSRTYSPWAGMPRWLNKLLSCMLQLPEQ